MIQGRPSLLHPHLSSEASKIFSFRFVFLNLITIYYHVSAHGEYFLWKLMVFSSRNFPLEKIIPSPPLSLLSFWNIFLLFWTWGLLGKSSNFLNLLLPLLTFCSTFIIFHPACEIFLLPYFNLPQILSYFPKSPLFYYPLFFFSWIQLLIF